MNFLEIVKKSSEKGIVEELKRIEKPLSLSDFIIRKNGIIGEFKRGTPTKKFRIGLLPEEVASIYEKYNLSAVSVVVEKRFFMTTEDDLKRIKNTVSIPVIQKGFIVEESQIIRARNNGADSILLIVRLLEKEKLINFLKLCKETQMEPIVELFSEKDIQIVKDLTLKIVGINNRDLETLKVDLDRGEGILSRVIEEKIGEIRIIESGIKKPEELLRFKKIGADGFLIGSAFLENQNIEEIVREFSEAIQNDKD